MLQQKAAEKIHSVLRDHSCRETGMLTAANCFLQNHSKMQMEFVAILLK